MKKNLFLASILVFTFCITNTFGQINIGTYGELNFQQEINDSIETQGNLNINRLFLTMASQVSNKLKFYGVLELNDATNFSVEQAWAEYKIGDKVNWRTGLVLVPMGKINLDHVSTTYNGSIRPLLDTYVVPSTWNAFGTGITGNLMDASVKYQAYILNGLNDFGLNGNTGLRNGVQGGGNAAFNNPNFAAKIDYYGFDNINIGISAYTGKTNNAIDTADNYLNVGMIGLDAQYKENNLALNGQLIWADMDEAEAYNDATGSDLGTNMLGYYLNIAYDYELNNGEVLVPFLTFERYANHSEVGVNETINDAYNRNVTTFGFGYRVSDNIVYKLDYQLYKNDAETNERNLLNAAVHFSF